jgi:type VII secretion integral membrane protein EccD
MTSTPSLPPSLAELDAPSGSDTGLIRVTVLVKGLRLDAALPADAEIRSYLTDLLHLANAQLTASNGRHTQFDDTPDRWSLAPLGAPVIELDRSLSAAGVFDGDVLIVRASAIASVPTLFDDVEFVSVASPARRWLTAHRSALTAFTLAFVAAVVWAWHLPQTGLGIVAAAMTLAFGVACVIASCVESRRPNGLLPSIALSVLAVPLLFIGSLCIIPNGFAVPSLPLAFAVVALAAQLSLQISRTGHMFHSFVIAASLLGGATAVTVNLWHPQPRALGSVVATVAVLVLYLAPRVTILLARLPMPRVPTAGEPLDDIETHGGTTVEGVSAIGLQVIPTEERLLQRVRRANECLTGILVGAGLTAIFGCYLAIDTSDGFYWQGSQFAVTVAAVLCLRGRTHHDLVQSATMIGSGLCIAVLLIGKTAAELPGWHVRAGLAALTLAALALLCGIIAPRLDFSPVMRRWVEILEYVAIGLIFPLCFWTVGLYSYVRGLRL